MQDATVTIDGEDRVAVVGELDALGCRAVRSGLLDALDRARGRSLTADFSEVGFVASSALALKLELDAKATATGGELSFVVRSGSPLDRQPERTGVGVALTVETPDPADTDGPDRSTDSGQS